ncbi:calcium-binding protein [Nocardioides bizhenqiangii]|uniref:Choice-of-anchor D domain-containing protein n=1 Tax=Nocardioides bizhenqiangii TaxID=3095076 RepID=A0ABZ0ZQW6_9ACTN|nr:MULTISPECIES: choice-of-anchor D domain-containing protein [unclassified Nocardioides]MDZ5619970.1 choice-of-anchor D domain-containing protein [Nocardioides sp. HM23]WQQ26027.1 choice-of-anchor D domain-containing protein [Nocardioides sp. HM61]
MSTPRAVPLTSSALRSLLAVLLAASLVAVSAPGAWAGTGGFGVTVALGVPAPPYQPFTIDPLALDYAPQTVGTSSPGQTVTVTNTGTGDLPIHHVLFNGGWGEPGEFQVTAETCRYQTLAPQDSCQVTVAFSPTATGEKTAHLEFTIDVPEPTPPVVLTGTATAPPAPCRGAVATLVGTPGPDVLGGTPGRDVIVGRGGDDQIMGRDGNDLICGGLGADVIRGGAGNDGVYGGRGADVIRGGAGDDRVHGARDADRLLGGAGDDWCGGGLGRDTARCETVASAVP